MNTGRLLTTALLILLVAAPAAWAQSPSDPVGERWVEGAAVDDVYSDLPEPVRDLRVQVWHPQDQDEEPYRRGESFELYFETNADAYVVIYRIDVDGRAEVLWPTSRYDDGFVYGNHTYTLPRPGSPNRLTAGRRKGVEYVQAIASELPFDLRNLSIDFRFDLGERGDYDYVVAGDPFLAVNDINFAITGLDEDVDYVVTDWSHLYVESRVDYARYSCTQCHATDTGHVVTSTATTTKVVRPYVDTCTTVNVYADWGWQRNWYGSFGWYPLYYEPAYYYWDPFYGRPYWYSYYPVYYSWPRYPVYARPYYWYTWHDSPWYGGDYRVRYTKGYVHDPLYDFDRVKTRRRDVPGLGDVATGLPASIDRVRGRAGAGRISTDRLVKDRTPSLVRGDLTPRVNRGDDRGRTGIRRDRVGGERRITSLAPDRERGASRGEAGRVRGSDRRVERDGSGTRTERRWTRPVIRNEERGRSSERSRVERERDTRRSTVDRDRAPARDRRIDRDRTPTRGREVERDRNPRRGSDVERDRAPTRRVQPERSRPERRVQPDRSRPERRVQPQRSRPERRVEPKRDAPQRRVEPKRDAPKRRVEPKRDAPKRRVEPKRSAPKREVERSRPAPPRRPQVQPQRSAPKRSEPSRGGSRGGGGSRTRNKGGGRG